MIEVEVKAPVAHPQEILQRLGTPHRTEEQEDRYYAHPCRDFASVDEALRIRRAGLRSELTWKGPKLDAATKTREERTVGVDDPSAAAQVLEGLGFRLVASVRKRRHTWDHPDLVYTLDDVEGLGTFLEVEAKSDHDHEAAKRRVVSALERLGLTQVRTSYLEMLLAKRP
ncbi:MAG: class IV adenylate cyclase [Thermoplasmatota archaeon]